MKEREEVLIVITSRAAAKYPASVLTKGSTPTKPIALIVDDETDICYLLKDILQRKFQSIAVNSLAEAKRYLQANEPTLIFLDNKLSDGFGMDHIHLFKEIYPSMKIIMITASDNFEDKEKALDEGADYFINKPFSVKTILEGIERIDL